MPKAKEIQEGQDPLTQVSGVGPAMAGKLREIGIDSIEALARYRPDELKDALKITLSSAKSIINSAKDIALDSAIEVRTLAKHLEWRRNVIKRIPTGAISLDNLLLGGIPTSSITVLSGEWGTGKTQFCFQLAVNAVKLGRVVAWIETEPSTFSPERIMQISEGSGVKINPEKDIMLIPSSFVMTPHSQFLAYEAIERKCKANNLDLGLLVVDSFTARFRSFYSGRDQLPARSSEMARHFGYLEELANKFNCAVVLTSQVMDTPDAGTQLHNIIKTGTRKEYVGGNILKHSGNYMLTLQKKSGDEYELIVADSSEIPRSSAIFRILPSGIRDVVTRGG